MRWPCTIRPASLVTRAQRQCCAILVACHKARDGDGLLRQEVHGIDRQAVLRHLPGATDSQVDHRLQSRVQASVPPFLAAQRFQVVRDSSDADLPHCRVCQSPEESRSAEIVPPLMRTARSTCLAGYRACSFFSLNIVSHLAHLFPPLNSRRVADHVGVTTARRVP